MPSLFKLFSPRREPPASSLQVGGQSLTLWFVHNPRARRYVLRLKPEGTVRLTIPRGGSEAKARRFAEQNLEWLQRQMQRAAARPVGKVAWPVGAEIFFRGEAVKIAADDDGRNTITFAGQTLSVVRPEQDHRPQMERHLHRLASVELPPRVFQLAEQHGLKVQRVTVRNQKSRWGSCSRRGTISLNWRLIQAPESVADYIIHHELMHLRQMNHSPKFWQEVEKVCPEYRAAEQWLKAHGSLLR